MEEGELIATKKRDGGQEEAANRGLVCDGGTLWESSILMFNSELWLVDRLTGRGWVSSLFLLAKHGRLVN